MYKQHIPEVNPVKGDVVSIYAYPLTQEEYLGEAELVSCLQDNIFLVSSGVRLQRWNVQFIETGEVIDKHILIYLTIKRRGEHCEF